MAKSPTMPPMPSVPLMPTLAAGAPMQVSDAPGESTAAPLPPLAAAVSEALAPSALPTPSLSPPAVGPVPVPLPPVQPFGTRYPEVPPVLGGADPRFDRRFAIDALLTHPLPNVRQRAEEARVALHHGAADAGLKMRAAIDVARAAEATR